MAPKPRILNDSRDMIWTLLALLVLVALVVVSSRNCSVGLHGNASDDKIPPFDTHAALQADAATMGFPIRQPLLPADWKPNSGTSANVGATRVSTVGWITPSGYYLGLSQTNATEEALLPTLSPDPDKEGTLSGTGTREIEGTRWVTYVAGDRLAPDKGVRKVWVANLGDVRIGLTGKSDDADFTTLARSVVQAKPLPSRR
ncbi:DUF4245 domain-containing protein [Gordonia sp. X0973]|uniref:DUF4245 domain-containing protein n=1 Tax=Gordonia sp. X0973 TaxID=2742602 RepID=UPI000F51AF9A|nr:DUF4245 domain-containing protein [Gordonia sp. X0973]QKT06647.1 DUF4245 domain-containing protein [Gordonia sp. X0973]